jgi:hypothetical protein
MPGKHRYAGVHDNNARYGQNVSHVCDLPGAPKGSKRQLVAGNHREVANPQDSIVKRVKSRETIITVGTLFALPQ